MDDLEEYSPQVGELEAMFNSAANYLQGLAATLPSEKLLFFYARYKQANEGTCNVPKPGFFDFKGKQKWDAWKTLGNMSKDDAMKSYVEGISDVDPDWQLKAQSDGKGGGGGGGSSWVRVSSLASHNKDSKKEEDKNHFDWVKENNLSKIRTLDAETLLEKDENGMGLLHWAADSGYTDMTKLLIEMGINVNTQDADDQTALHYAASCGHEEVVKLLLSQGADSTIADSDGQLAVDCADDDNIKDLLK